MLPATITIDLGSVSEPNDITVSRINQDNYSSEYRGLDTAGNTVRAFFRHSTEKALLKGRKMDRHQILVQVETPPDAVFPLGSTHEAYVIARVPQGMAVTDAIGPLTAIFRQLYVRSEALVNWEN